jgi:hypothetical protein
MRPFVTQTLATRAGGGVSPLLPCGIRGRRPVAHHGSQLGQQQQSTLAGPGAQGKKSNAIWWFWGTVVLSYHHWRCHQDTCLPASVRIRTEPKSREPNSIVNTNANANSNTSVSNANSNANLPRHLLMTFRKRGAPGTRFWRHLPLMTNITCVQNRKVPRDVRTLERLQHWRCDSQRHRP